ncbi:MAG: phosphoglucosamine mutase [Clostridiales bacterium]|nr:phosphoglucosamine mutase [Clostridiales bacterium]
MTKYFGTDGFRGEAGEDLTAPHAFAIGRFLGYYFGREGRACRVVIGKDTRRSSYMFESALSAGLTASGADAHLLHVTTTPCVSYITRTEGFDCGIMISASHNPYYDNGIKLFNAAGEKMEDAVIEKIEAYLDGDIPEVPFAHREHIGRTVDYIQGRRRYIAYLTSLAIRSFKGKRIGLDCANGSTWQTAKNVFDALGAETFVIGNHPDGTNINAGFGSTCMGCMQKFVLENQLDAGFSFDGDGDRCLAVDEKGNLITGDHILYLYARYMKERGKLENNTVVTTVMANLGLFRAFDELDIHCEITAVGDRYVYECMRDGGHLLGGEQSGHIIFSKYATTGDGVLTAIKVMQVMLSRNQTLSELAAPMRVFPQVLKNVVVADKEQGMADAGVLAAVAEVEKRLGNAGRVLLRPSGTEPLLRVMVEAGTVEECHACADLVVDALNQVIANNANHELNKV